ARLGRAAEVGVPAQDQLGVLQRADRAGEVARVLQPLRLDLLVLDLEARLGATHAVEVLLLARRVGARRAAVAELRVDRVAQRVDLLVRRIDLEGVRDRGPGALPVALVHARLRVGDEALDERRALLLLRRLAPRLLRRRGRALRAAAGLRARTR